MKAVIQITERANVSCSGKTTGEISKGLLILIGVDMSDTDKEAYQMADKIANLRIFKDEDDKMNFSLLDIGGEVLVVSNFTLCADASHGRRPSYSCAARPDKAVILYDLFCNCLKRCGVRNIEKGVFGADMKVTLCNDGPVTLILDTDKWIKK